MVDSPTIAGDSHLQTLRYKIDISDSAHEQLFKN